MYLPYSLAIGKANMYCLGLWNEFVNLLVLFLLINYFFVIFQLTDSKVYSGIIGL